MRTFYQDAYLPGVTLFIKFSVYSMFQCVLFPVDIPDKETNTVFEKSITWHICNPSPPQKKMKKQETTIKQTLKAVIVRLSSQDDLYILYRYLLSKQKLSGLLLY